MNNDHLMKRIIANAGIIFCGNSMASVLNIASFALLARALGPELLAIFVLVQTYVLIVNDIFNIQTWESMVKFGGSKSNSNSFKDVIKLNLFLDCLSALLSFLFSLLLIFPATYLFNWDNTYIYIFQIYSVSILFNITSLSIGIPRLFDKFLSVAKIQVVVALFKVTVVASIFYMDMDFLYFIISYLLFDVLTNLLLILYSVKLLSFKLGNRWWKHKLNIDKEQLRFIWWSNLRTIIRIPVRHFDVLVISIVLSLPMLGYYKVYKELASVINRIGDPVNQAIFPEFTKLIGRGDSQQSVLVAKKTIFLMLFVAVALTLTFLVTANPIVHYVFGYDYLEYLDVLYAMIIVSGIGFALVPIDSLFIAAGFARMSFFIVAFTNLVYIIIAYFGGMSFGLYGVVFANAAQKVLNKLFKVFLMVKYPSGWRDIAR